MMDGGLGGSLPTEDQMQLLLWQRAAFLETGHSARDTADSLRLQLGQLDFYRRKKEFSGEDIAHIDKIKEELVTNYGQAVDGKKGMDHYLSAAKQLVPGHINSLQDFKSDLTLDSVLEMPEVQKMLKENKKPAVLKRNVPFSNPLLSRGATQHCIVRESVSSNNSIENSRELTQQRHDKPAPSQPPSAAPIPSSRVLKKQPASSRPGPVFNGREVADGERYPRNKRPRREDLSEEPDDRTSAPQAFITARDQHHINQQKKFGGSSERVCVSSNNYGASKRSLGARRTPGGKFIPPVKQDSDGGSGFTSHVTSKVMSHGGPERGGGQFPPELEGNERLKNIEPRMVELILNEIMDSGALVQWDDIAGLQYAKESIKEIVVWPMMRPDLFTGLRGPPKGILLFGPPGTGKTLIGKCVASQVCATFFSISASSLTSKWIGEGEKMVRALFAVARCYQPAVVFIDEIDSLLSQRSDTEHESSRRIKTEFLVQLDGATTSSDDRLLVIGATNRPQEIDEAARRRLVKRLYIPLPDHQARKQIVANLMQGQPSSLTGEEMEDIARMTGGYSGADMTNLCREAAYGPVREAAGSLQHITADQMRPVNHADFESALKVVKASVSEKDLDMYLDWNKQFGCGK